jgi:hypothetical protein
MRGLSRLCVLVCAGDFGDLRRPDLQLLLNMQLLVLTPIAPEAYLMHFFVGAVTFQTWRVKSAAHESGTVRPSQGSFTGKNCAALG